MTPRREFYANPGWDVEGWVDIIGVEYEQLIAAYPFDDVFRSLGGSVRLLDVGCGTAIFPRFLDRVLSPEVHITADLLDRSRSSLDRATEVMRGLEHFSVGEAFEAEIEALPPLGEAAYDVIWAIHSLTTVDRSRMPQALQTLLAAVRSDGWLLVYQLTSDSAYQRIHGRYRAGRGGDRYMEFEDTGALMEAAGVDFDAYELVFDHVVPDEPEALRRYLGKVTLDDSVTPEALEPVLREYRGNGVVRFPQTVNLIAAPGWGGR